MKKYGRVFVMVVGCVLTVCTLVFPANAQLRFGAQGNFGDDVDFGVGARMTTDLAAVKGLSLTGAFDYFFPDGFDYFEVNANATYNFAISNSQFVPYVGGGLTFGRASFDSKYLSDWSDNEIMPSILGGAKILMNNGMSPFLELRIELSGYEQFVITGGILF